MASVVLDAELLDGLARFMADRTEPPGAVTDVETAANVIIRDWLQGQVYMPLAAEENEIIPALTASGVLR
jgi:hypothetical protein